MKKVTLLLLIIASICLLCACGNGNTNLAGGSRPAPATKPSQQEAPKTCLGEHDFTNDAAACLVCGIDYFSATLDFKLTDARTSYTVTGLGSCTRTEIIIPATHKGKPVNELSTTAFSGVVNPRCQNITKITIPSSVTKIGSNAFHKCVSLTSIELAEGIVSIGMDSFRECIALESLVFPSTVTEITERIAYLCDTLKTVEIKGQVTSIGSSAFQDCPALEAIVLPDTVKTLGVGAFTNCTSLRSISVPSGLETIGRQVFDGCTSLEYNVYEGMSYLGNEDNPYVVLMGRYDENQKQVLMHSETTLMMPTALEGLDITSLTINAKMSFINHNSLMKLPQLAYIYVEEGNPTYHTAGNCLIETETKKLIRGTSNSVIPDDGSVTILNTYAFGYLENLTSIVIPDTVTDIGNGAFIGCINLENVVIGTGVTMVNLESFDKCTNMKVFYKGTFEQWAAINIPVGGGSGALSFGDNDEILNAPRYYYSETKPESGGYWWHFVDGVPTLWPVE